MNLTLSLEEPLADELRREAAARCVSVEQVAHDLLGSALRKRREEEAWRQVNQRRGELIRKSRNSGLSTEESKELDQLQAAIDQRLEPMDRHLLADAEE